MDIYTALEPAAKKTLKKGKGGKNLTARELVKPIASGMGKAEKCYTMVEFIAQAAATKERLANI